MTIAGEKIFVSDSDVNGIVIGRPFHLLYDTCGERWSHGKALDCQSGDSGSIPPTAVSKLRQFHSPHICLCLSEETLKASVPFYMVTMPGEIKYPI